LRPAKIVSKAIVKKKRLGSQRRCCWFEISGLFIGENVRGGIGGSLIRFAQRRKKPQKLGGGVGKGKGPRYGIDRGKKKSIAVNRSKKKSRTSLKAGRGKMGFSVSEKRGVATSLVISQKRGRATKEKRKREHAICPSEREGGKKKKLPGEKEKENRRKETGDGRTQISEGRKFSAERGGYDTLFAGLGGRGCVTGLLGLKKKRRKSLLAKKRDARTESLQRGGEKISFR